jgi:hypothetical protein
MHEYYAGRGLSRARRSRIGIEREPRARAGKGRKRPTGRFRIDTALGLRWAGVAVLQAFRNADRDSIRGHHYRFVCRRLQLARHSTRN